MTRVIVEFNSEEDAKKVEETVKTGYSEASIDILTQWEAVEEDLADTYGRLAEEFKDPSAKNAFRQLQAESKNNIARLGKLREALEDLDSARVRRIKLLTGLSQ
jgi:hypothetical protein